MPSIDTVEELEIILISKLECIGSKYDIDLTKCKYSVAMFDKLISKLGPNLAIIIDEYDQPLNNLIFDLNAAEPITKYLKKFYSVLKDY